jgi:hypothetical protein
VLLALQRAGLTLVREVITIGPKSVRPPNYKYDAVITDPYVPVGSLSMNVSDPSNFVIGDSVAIIRRVSTMWLDLMVRPEEPEMVDSEFKAGYGPACAIWRKSDLAGGQFHFASVPRNCRHSKQYRHLRLSFDRLR